MVFRRDDYKFGEKFKLKSMKVYCSTEWMFGATKKYRQVFDKNEVDYIRVEFNFYNKLFDEQQWDAEIRLKAFDITGKKRKEICDQKEELTVKPEDNVITIYKGWGTDKLGGFWEKGDYVWEAYIDDKLVGTKKFHIEDVGKVTPKNNPYFQVESLKVYNGPFDGWNLEDRKYLKRFNRKDTLFVWAETKLKILTNKDFHIELFTNFYDDAGQLKGQVVTLDYIPKDKKDYIYTFQEGWGSKSGGSWHDDKYTAEIVFMDTRVAVLPFEVGDAEIEGSYPWISGEKSFAENPHTTTSTQAAIETVDDNETLEDVLKQLDELIGLQSIKQQIREHIAYLDFLKLRREKGFEDDEEILLHSVFTGNPGTGKTTVVNLLGKIYAKMGLLSKGHVFEVDRSDLVGEFIGQTAPKTKKAIEEARGGILFIDEAYALTRENKDSKDFGREVIEVLLKELSDGDGDLAVMVAGYPKEMKDFVDSNPGIKSRFKYYFHFDDYLPEELFDIAKFAAKKRNVFLTSGANELIKKLLVDAYRDRDRTFGNARYAYSLIDEGKMNLGLRLMKHPNVKKLSNRVLSTIKKEDIEKIIIEKQKRKVDIAIDEPLLKESLAELNSLVGLSNIKKEVNELVKLVRYYRETGKDVLNRFSLHTVFKGNPGTGKTTVARIMGKIYKALGLLERGHIVECDREGLVAGYIGQTAIKTKQRIDEARNGVLFIDEAYALAEEKANSFGNEAIEVILKNMEDLRGQLAVIVAGYPDNMNQFLKSNPGLKSRFDRTFDFQDFNAVELYKIALLMFGEENLYPDTEAEAHLKNYINYLLQGKDKYFGNARTIRKLVAEAVKNQNLRMASMPPEMRTKVKMETLTIDDVSEFEVKGQQDSRKGRIGFRISE